MAEFGIAGDKRDMVEKQGSYQPTIGFGHERMPKFQSVLPQDIKLAEIPNSTCEKELTILKGNISNASSLDYKSSSNYCRELIERFSRILDLYKTNAHEIKIIVDKSCDGLLKELKNPNFINEYSQNNLESLVLLQKRLESLKELAEKIIISEPNYLGENRFAPLPKRDSARHGFFSGRKNNTMEFYIPDLSSNLKNSLKGLNFQTIMFLNSLNPTLLTVTRIFSIALANKGELKDSEQRDLTGALQKLKNDASIFMFDILCNDVPPGFRS